MPCLRDSFGRLKIKFKKYLAQAAYACDSPIMKTQQVGSGIYNTAPYLLRNYGLSASESSPTKAVELQISQDGSVGNGMFVIARFPTRRQAINTLKAAGWNVYKSDCARFTEE